MFVLFAVSAYGAEPNTRPIWSGIGEEAYSMTAPNPNYPVSLVLAGRRCLVVGGGHVAQRKVAGLVAAGAAVTVVAPAILAEISSIDAVCSVTRRYHRSDLEGVRLAIACTDDGQVNHQVYVDGEEMGVWVNSADDPVNCAFTLPAVARQGELSVAISTAGRSPALAMWMRRKFEAELDQRYADGMTMLSDIRDQMRLERGTSEVSGWIEALDSGILDRLAVNDKRGAEQLLRQHLDFPERRAS